MDNLALQMIDEEINEGFKIDNDGAAEWALKKIAEETAEAQRYINVCDTMINEYTTKKQKAIERLESKTAYLKSKLQEYFLTVPHKTSKTQETYSLPSGTLKLKYGTPEFVRDDDKFVKWLKDNKLKDYYEEKTIPKWSEFKKTIIVKDEKILTADGEIVDGVKAVERPNEFKVEI